MRALSAGNSRQDIQVVGTKQNISVSEEEGELRRLAVKYEGSGSSDEYGMSWHRRFGITDSAWDGWGQIHVQPSTAMGHFYVSEAGFNLAGSCLVSGVPINRLWNMVAVPLMLTIITNVVIDVAFWRLGPNFVRTKAYALCIMVNFVGTFPLVYAGYLASLSWVPWNNRLHFVCVHAVMIFFANQSATAGKIVGEQPQEPRTTIMHPFLRATLRTLHFVDGLTDLSMILTFIEAKGKSCWWFGKAGYCAYWNALIVALSVCAAVDLTLVAILSFLGKESTTQSTRMRRLAITLEGLCLICELGVVLCTLVYLFSVLQAPASKGGMDTSDTLDQIILSFISLASTLLVSCIRVIGISKTLSAAVKVLNTIRVSMAGRIPFQAALAKQRTHPTGVISSEGAQPVTCTTPLGCLCTEPGFRQASAFGEIAGASIQASSIVQGPM